MKPRLLDGKKTLIEQTEAGKRRERTEIDWDALFSVGGNVIPYGDDMEMKLLLPPRIPRRHLINVTLIKE